MDESVKVGDELAFHRGREWVLRKVENITPSGWIRCGGYTLNPDLSIRGADKWGPHRATIVTQEIRDQAERCELVAHLERKATTIRSLPLESLRRIKAAFDADKEKNDA